MSRLHLVLGVCVLGTLVALIASAAGWLGAVSACGADNTPGCAAWSTPVSELVWLAFVAGVAALLYWQVRT